MTRWSAVVLLAFLLHGYAVQAASVPRHYRLRGGEGEGQPAAYPPSSDMIKALEYIENLKQRNGGRPEPVDTTKWTSSGSCFSSASQQDESPGDRQPAPGKWTGRSVSRRKQRGRRCNAGQARTKRRPTTTPTVDYYLLKVLEMSDQTQRRDKTGEQRKRLIRPSLVDPRTVKQLLQLSLKLHVPPQDLIRHDAHRGAQKVPREPQPRKPVPEDMDREDFLDIIGVETISNEYPLLKSLLLRAQGEPLFIRAQQNAAETPQSDVADDEDDEGEVEDEVTTYLAAKILTEYPKPHLQEGHPGPRVMKDYLGQADTEKRPVAKRETEEATEEIVEPTEMQEEITAKTSAPQTVDVEVRREKKVAGM
uniref:Secretogranin II (chromogranin C), b n=1 Tax=Cyclopterus lumpus TaxID=8103 RepID=A0A8C2WVV7_CYCLU